MGARGQLGLLPMGIPAEGNSGIFTPGHQDVSKHFGFQILQAPPNPFYKVLGQALTWMLQLRDCFGTGMAPDGQTRHIGLETSVERKLETKKKFYTWLSEAALNKLRQNPNRWSQLLGGCR